MEEDKNILQYTIRLDELESDMNKEIADMEKKIATIKERFRLLKRKVIMEYKGEIDVFVNIHGRFVEETFIKTDDENDIITEREMFEEFNIYCCLYNYKDGKKDKIKVIQEIQKLLDYRKIKNKTEFLKIKRREDANN